MSALYRLFKRCGCGKSRWPRCPHAYWYQWRRTRKTLGVSDRKAAELQFAEVQRHQASPAYARSCEITVGQLTEEFKRELPTLGNREKPLAQGTLGMYGYHLGHFDRVFGEETPLAKIDAAAWDRYVKSRRSEAIGDPKKGKRVGSHTVSKEQATFAKMWGFALRRGYTETAIDRILPPSSNPNYVPVARSLTEDQIPVLLSALHSRPERLAVVAYTVGLGADVVAWDRARVEDFGPELVLVRGSKNALRCAHVPIVEPFWPCVAIARDWLQEHGSFRPWGNAVRDLAVVCEAAGLPRVTPRDLRRTFGEVLRARGVDPKLIGLMLRHADSRMAEKVYARLRPEDLSRLVRGSLSGNADG
jgi:integrase